MYKVAFSKLSNFEFSISPSIWRLFKSFLEARKKTFHVSGLEYHDTSTTHQTKDTEKFLHRSSLKKVSLNLVWKRVSKITFVWFSSKRRDQLKKVSVLWKGMPHGNVTRSWFVLISEIGGGRGIWFMAIERNANALNFLSIFRGFTSTTY